MLADSPGTEGSRALVTNWVSDESGVIVPSDIRVFPGRGDGIYEVQYTGDMVGLSVGTDFDSQYIAIQSVSLSSALALSTVSVGDILVAVNNRDVIYEEFEDVIDFIQMIKMCGIPCRLRFVSPEKCSVNEYEVKMNLRKKSHKDMYGFIRSMDYLTSERLYRATRIGLSAQLDLDWIEYLKSIGGPGNLKPYGTFRPTPQLKLLVRRGIPVALRPLVWPFISRTDQYCRQFPDGYYDSLLLLAENKLDAKVKDDIEKDLDRTFPGHDYFQTADGINSLRRVLSAFGMKNEQIGYCQSLNFLAGAMLLFMEEESAFWLLCHVVEELLPKDYYTPTMIGTYVDQFVLAYLIKTTMPRLHSLLQSFEMQLPLVAVEWFMCLFVNTLRPEVAFRVWDIFLNEGAKVLFRIAMALLKRHEDRLLQATDGGQLFMAIKEIGIDIVNPDDLIELAFKSYKCPPVSNYSSSKISSILTPSSGSMVLKRSNMGAMKSVPRDLIGLGLAHLGPQSLYGKLAGGSRATASSSDPLSSYVTDVIAGRRPSVEVTEQVAQAEILAENTKKQIEMQKVEKVKGNELADNGADSLALTSTAASQSAKATASSGQNGDDDLSESRHALHHPVYMEDMALPTYRARRKRDAYRNFGRSEIASWRTQFRPEVENRILSMENARLEYRRRREEMESSSANLQVADRDGALKGNGAPTCENGDTVCNNLTMAAPRNHSASIEIPRTLNSKEKGPPVTQEEEDASDDGDEYEMARRESLSMSPEVKMHGAAPQLWNLLFEERSKERNRDDSSS